MPSPEIVEKALEQIRKRPANHDYFFSKLDSPEWIKPLQDAGLFAVPPIPVRDAGSISFPFWPESRYLARIASKDPTAVLETIESIPATDNVRVLEDYADAGLAMPGRLAARLATRLCKWVERQTHLYFLLPEQLAKLGEHLAATGEVETAFVLFRALLRVGVAPKNENQPLPLFSTWSYEKILKSNLKTFPAADGLRLLDFLSDLLFSAVTDKADTYSYVWRPAIEDHSQNHRHGDVRDSLINSVRDTATELCHSDIDCENVLLTLSKRPRQIFRRLVIHFLATHQEQLPDEARNTALAQDAFDDLHLRHEYVLLLKTVLPRLDAPDQGKIADWIESGPNADHLDPDPTTQSAQREYWQARWLAALDEAIPASWRRRFIGLMEIAKTIEHPDFVSYSMSWSGPNSPRSADELLQMPVETLAGYLKSWQPPDRWDSPTPEGLGRALQSVVTKDASRFSADLSMFVGIDATYVRAITQGFRDALESLSELDWIRVLDYLGWAVSNRDESPINDSSYHDKDPHWGWSRKAIADLLGKGFQKDHIPTTLRGRAWAVLEPLTDDADPRVEDESKEIDPATRSINSTRGEAMHAVIQYALWIYRAQPRVASTSSTGLDLMPEVREILERHIDPNRDAAATIRAVYGQHFPWLALIDRNWALSHRTAIFPGRTVDPRLHAAAWDTYLVFCKPYNEMLSVLAKEYEAAVDSASEEPFGDHDLADPRERLAEHLVVFLGRGLIPPEDEQSLCLRFLRNAPSNFASHMIRFVGRSLGEEGPIPPDVLRRFKAFWEAFDARSIRDPISDDDTMKAFGTWVASNRFDFAWSSRIAIDVLKRGHGIDDDYDVVAVLKQHAKEHPQVAVKVLAELIRSDTKSWAVHAWKDDARDILETALDDEAAAEGARAVIHELGSRGFLEFRRLLKSPRGQTDNKYDPSN